MSASLQHDRYECVKAGRASFLATTVQKHADPRVDADGGAQRGHLPRHILDYAVPRILPSPRFPSVPTNAHGAGISHPSDSGIVALCRLVGTIAISRKVLNGIRAPMTAYY